MKKCLGILVLIAIFSCDSAYAQQNFSLKGMGGLSYNRRNLDSKYKKKVGGNANYRHPWGYNIGLLGDVRLNSILKLETGFLYSTNQTYIVRSEKPEQVSFGEGLEEQTVYHFINVPLNLLIMPKTESGFYGGVGMPLFYNINSKRKGNNYLNPTAGPSYSDEFSMKSDLGKSISLQANAFVGKDWQVGKGFIGLRLQYSFDVTQWEYPTALDIEDEEGYKMHGHYFSINFLAGLR